MPSVATRPRLSALRARCSRHGTVTVVCPLCRKNRTGPRMGLHKNRTTSPLADVWKSLLRMVPTPEIESDMLVHLQRPAAELPGAVPNKLAFGASLNKFRIEVGTARVRPFHEVRPSIK